MSANQHTPTLFYSERDVASKEIVQTLQALNKASLYRFVNIDVTPRQYLPPTLQRIPTLVIPNTKETLVGKAAIFAHISKPVQSRREHPSDKPPPPTQPTEPSTWSFSGSGLSETFSSFDSAQHQTDDQLYFSYIQAQQQQGNGVGYSGVAKESGGGGFAGGGDAEGSKTGRNGDVAARLEAYKTNRDAEFKPMQRI